MNLWVVGIIRYGAGVIDWMKEELKSIDIRTRKLMTMNGSRHLRENVGRLYLEVQSLNKYLSKSEGWILKFAAGEKGLSEVEDPDAFKKRLKKEK